MKTLAKYAKARIRALGKSQKVLAQELDVSPAYISQILTGKKSPPDLGRPKNRAQLRAWAQFLQTNEADIVDLVRFELHRIPPKPDAKFPKMRDFLLAHADSRDETLSGEIRALALHPAESQAIEMMSQIYLVMQEDCCKGPAHKVSRFLDLSTTAKTDKNFVENVLAGFFSEQEFSWKWNFEENQVDLDFRSQEILDAQEQIRKLLSMGSAEQFLGTVPVVGHVSAGDGFEFKDGGFQVGEGFEQVPLPPGADPGLARSLYCVRVRGDSLKEFFGNGTLLFIKPESWEEIRDGDLVIFKDKDHRRAFVKKIDLAGESLILKPMNHHYGNMVVKKSDLMLLERVIAIVL